MKKFAALTAAAILMLSMMTGCSSTCKEAGCDDPAAKNGYCEVHYALHELSKLFGS